jgi:hypothetical protein
MRIHRLAAALVLSLLVGLMPATASADQPGLSFNLRSGQVQGTLSLHGYGVACGLEVNSFTITIAGAGITADTRILGDTRLGVMPGDNVRWDLSVSGTLQLQGESLGETFEHGSMVTMEDLMLRVRGSEGDAGVYEVTGQVRGGTVALVDDPSVSGDVTAGRFRGLLSHTPAEAPPVPTCEA